MPSILFPLLLTLTTCILYSIDPSYKVALQPSQSQLVHCYYQEKIRQSGWNRFYIQGNPRIDMVSQYRGGGFCEGYATYKEIYYAYVNYVGSLAMKGKPNVDSRVKNFQDEQLSWINQMYGRNSKDLYWQQVYALTEQLRFMYRGFLTRLHEENRLDMYIGFSQFYYLTNMGDLEDIIPAFTGIQIPDSYRKSCSSFVKIVNGDLLVAHNTWNQYALMLRFMKSYNYPSINSRIAASRTVFSARPGDLQSKDDFFLLSSGLSVTQTSLQNYAPENFKLLRPQTVPTWIRVNVANRLAKTAQQWKDIFLAYRSGTHNNQWIITDLKQYKKINKTEILLVQEAFDLYSVTNFTDRFYEKGYVASYNVPFNKTLWDKLNYSAWGFDFDNDERAILFEKYDKLMTDYDSFKIMNRVNEDEDKADGLAPRNDLSKKDRFPYGMIDMKIANQNSLEDNYIEAISSPPVNLTNNMPPFSWKDWPNQPHLGMPDDWNFDFVKIPISLE